jgi:hypothetical protein
MCLKRWKERELYFLTGLDPKNQTPSSNQGMKNSLTWPQVSAFRLSRHHLLDRKPADLTKICQDVCGIQAQLMPATEMQFWARRHDLTRTEIDSALWKRRSLIKTSCMRQTLHVIPAADFSIYINALKRSRGEALRRMMFKYGKGITPKEIEAMNEAIMEALRAGPKTQRELTECLRPRVGKKMRTYMKLAWSIQTFRSALVEGLICFGPEQDNKATFVRVDQWLPKQKEVPEQEAKQILLRRYLRVNGPATLRDFSKWSGIPTKEAGGVWESVKDELIEVAIEDTKAFMLQEDFRELAKSALDDQVLRLLPHFDPYMLGHAEKDYLVEASHYKRVYSNQGWISPVVLLNGRVIGVWSYKRGGKRWSLEIEPFEKFSKSLRAKIEEETTSLGKFLETSWEIKFGKSAGD